MKLSRCRRYTKHYKYMRHTKHGGGGKKYKTKRTYHKHSRKLKHKSRLQKGGMWRSRKVAPELFEFPTPAPYNELINYQDMTVSTNSRGNDTYSFVNTSGQSPIFYSSTGKRNMVLSFIKVQPGRTKSLTKHFNWLIALKQIEDITRPEGLYLMFYEPKALGGRAYYMLYSPANVDTSSLKQQGVKSDEQLQKEEADKNLYEKSKFEYFISKYGIWVLITILAIPVVKTYVEKKL